MKYCEKLFIGKEVFQMLSFCTFVKCAGNAFELGKHAHWPINLHRF